MGRTVILEQLRIEHARQLTEAANADRGAFRWTQVPDSEEAMRTYIEAVLADQRAADAVPFVQLRAADGAVVGCTRYMRLEWWSGRPLPAEVEVGGTWLAASVQRSALNTEAKYLLFRHAFEAWGVNRVSLCTDTRNERSRAAIERVGGRFEGIARSHRPSFAGGAADGLPRDSAMFGITAGDWPELEARLVAMLDR